MDTVFDDVYYNKIKNEISRILVVDLGYSLSRRFTQEVRELIELV